ncbi:hypothetical protein [Aquimarina longa]|uniref:hypothetical protein n=1 Tax=Aquimarina longa TaxID=1080221 RepID=UPI000782E20A|nr:hypothetical protein [Aquimarina longa]
MDSGDFIYMASVMIPLFAFFFLRKQLDENNLWFIIGGGIVTVIGYVYIYKYYRRQKNTLFKYADTFICTIVI